MDTERAEINGELLRSVRSIAREESRDEREVLEEAVELFLSLRSRFSTSDAGNGSETRKIYEMPHLPSSAGSLKEYFEDAARWQEENGVEPLSDEEAMKLADEELRAMRRERDERP